MYLTRIDDAARMNRYYAIENSPDLFGDTLLIRSWGRIGSRGQQHRQWFDGPESAAVEQQKWAARKQRRGYREADG